MILINLLPHREVARKRKREAFFITLGIAAVIGVLICGVWYSWYRAQIQIQQTRNVFLQTEITVLEEKINGIATLQAEIASLRARQTAVENLQGDRNLPVYLMTELVKQLPDGVYIKSFKQDNQTVLIEGVAQTNQRVSELLHNFASNSPWLSKPELVEIAAGTVVFNARDQRRVANFAMRVEMKREKNLAASAAASAASAPASSASKI